MKYTKYSGVKSPCTAKNLLRNLHTAYFRIGAKAKVPTSGQQFNSTASLLYNMGRIFQEQHPRPLAGMRVAVDSKLRRQIREKKIDIGHKTDDHEEQAIGLWPILHITLHELGRRQYFRALDIYIWQMGGGVLAYYDSICQDTELSHRAKTVYIYLKDHANKKGTCWPGINTIASGVSLSRSTVKRALDDLVRAGLVKKSRRWRENGSLSSNLYQITS